MSLVASVETKRTTIALILDPTQIANLDKRNHAIKQLMELPDRLTVSVGTAHYLRVEFDPRITSIPEVQHAAANIFQTLGVKVHFTVTDYWYLQVNFKRTLDEQSRGNADRKLRLLGLTPFTWSNAGESSYALVDSTQELDNSLVKAIKHAIAF